MPDEKDEYTVADAQASILKAIIEETIAAGLHPNQVASIADRLGRAIRLIPPELRAEALSPELFEGVSRNLGPRSDT